MNIYLERYGSFPGIGTFGKMIADDSIFYTVEKEWLNNQPYISCIPAGDYRLENHDSAGHPQTYAMVNHDLGVYHYEDSDSTRFACLIHVANYPHEVVGCIGPGLTLTQELPKGLGVTNSGNSMNKLRELLPRDEDHTITIAWRNYGNL